MSTPRVLIVEAATTASAMGAALERRGFAVRTAATIEEALAHGSPDVLVAETELPDGTGHDLVARFREAGGRPRTVFVSARPTIESCRQALLLGAADFLTKPFRLDELVRAVENARGAPPRERSSESRATTTGRFERSFAATETDVDVATRELASWLVRLGAGPSCRTRIVSAAAELFDNVRRHAYAGAHDDPTFQVEVEADERFITLTVADRGAGFDPGEVADYAFESPTHNGFARAACLAEDVQLESRLGEGSRITLRFASYRVDFDEDDHIDLTELDYLTPELARRVLEALHEDSNDDPFRLSPAMAVAVGRLLAGPDPGKRLQLRPLELAMGLDDFLSEDDEPLELPPEGVAESDDDDLFDLRPIDELDGPAAEDAPAADAPSTADDAAHVPDVPDAVAADASPAAADAPTPATAALADDDGEFDLDEDLFDFGSPGDEHLDSLLSLGNDLADVLSEVGAAPSLDEIEDLTSVVNEIDLALDDLDPSAADRDDGAEADEEPPLPRRTSGRNEPLPPTVVIDPRLVRSRPSWLAIVSVLGANFILLFFAWSASRSLHADLTAVREEIRQQPAPRAGDDADETEATTTTTTDTESPDAGASGQNLVQTPVERPVTLPRLPGAASMALAIAEREIADERFGAARRRLYELLATADDLAPKDRDAVEARALYLIGDTYVRQATLGEGRP